MPVPVKVRGPRPPAVSTAVTSVASPRRPETRGARHPGPADVVRAQSVMGNAAVSAVLGGRPPGSDPKPGSWARPLGQQLVGNQAVASQAPPVVKPPAPVAQQAKPAAADRKPEPEQSTVERPEKQPPKEKAAGPRTPGADPKFQALKKDVAAKKKTVGASHPPAAAEAGSAQAAAAAPADDQEARGKAAHAEDMDAAQPKEFDKKAFVDAVKKAVADKAPKNLDEADKFGKSGKAGEIKNEVQDKVGEGKDASAKEIADTTAAPPEPAPDAKRVVPMTPDKVPAKPGTPDPAQAAPDTLPPSATDLSAGPERVDKQLADANVTEQQLKFPNSHEPGFDKAVQDKKAMDAHSEAAPKKLRAGEHREIGEVKAGAAARGSAAMAGIHATRVTTGKRVGTGKAGTKKTDEDKRKEVTDLLQKVFDRTKGDVEQILTDLDKKVDDEFTTKEQRARDRFTQEHEDGMRRYKDERYGGWDGWIKWGRDLFAGLPEEADRIYESAKDHYLTAMGLLISDIADLVERELRRAKDRIATGRGELQAAVEKLPADLKAIGREAAADFDGQFDQLKETVDDKGTELVDTLATKYTDAVKAVDAEIAAEKEKNKGLVAKAADAIGGAIKAIVELGRMLLGVLAKAVSAIGAILKDPIGFLGNLVTGVGGGLKLFIRNAGKHLQQGVLAWLLGTAATAGLQLPTTFDIAGILVLIATLLGISWPNIRSRLVRKVPEKAVVAAEVSVPVLIQVKRRGILGMVDDVKSRVGDLKKTLIDDLVSYLLPTIIIAGITWILSLFNPASAFIRACKMIIDIIRFVVLNARQIIDFVNAVLDAVLAIARGGTGGVPALVERALARAVPVLIGALAALLGIGGIAGKVRQIFQKLSRPVNRAIDWVIDKIAGLVKKLWAKLKPKLPKPRHPVGRPDARVPARPRRPRPADRRKPPRRLPREDPALRRRLMAALHEAGRLADRVSGDPDAVRRGLPAIKSRYRLTVLTATTRPGAGEAVLFVFDGAINPRAKFEHLANDRYLSEARRAYKRPDPKDSLDFAIDDRLDRTGAIVPGLTKVLGLGATQARKYAEKWVRAGKLSKTTMDGRAVYSFVHLTEDDLKDPAKHPERARWMAGAAKIHLSSATAAHLWDLVITGLRDRRPGNFEIVADELMRGMRIAPGKGALWSKGEDISEYAAGLGFAALETQEFYEVTKGLTLLDNWPLVRPLWMTFSRRYAGILRKEIHIFVRQFLASSVLLETELPTVRRIMRSTGITIALKFHGMEWGDDPTKILENPVPRYWRELLADGTPLPEGRQHELDEPGARTATARARLRFTTSQANKRAAGTRTPTGDVDPDALERLMSALPVVPTAPSSLRRFARAAVRAAGEVELVPVGGGYSGAPVQRILDAGGTLLGVLKIFPSREQFAMELSALARLGRVRIVDGRAVAALGVARASRRPTTAGLVVTSPARGGDVEGMMKETGDTPSGPERAKSFAKLSTAVAGIGRTLARLHTTPKGSGGAVSDTFLRRHIDDVLDRRGKLPGFRAQLIHAGIDFGALQSRIDALVAGFRAHPGGSALVHGDAHPGNYFFDAADGVTIIDVTTLHLSIDARGNPIGAPSRDVGVFAQQLAHYSVTLKLNRGEVATLQGVFRSAYTGAGGTSTTPQADAFFRARASLGWLMRVLTDLRDGTVRGVVPSIDRVQQQHIDLAVEAFGL
ncbi:Phosphotransferase enzyme family protein [Amycolatopsis pretoriensis]|uniref:Phosphotransferase enzyme family protein n=1 Tax=Amycolatopsis pretoriensis TaxID=218821 RepID=A0A1H5QF21_9PSEU|nr:phosphotransferase [Amycolatopsis pretoriensis]SEF24444.1 Phosphotransferase enzyme family protein [Amycolatopsis pretoriensis]